MRKVEERGGATGVGKIAERIPMATDSYQDEKRHFIR